MRRSLGLFSDPACPWGYSANPALRVIEWRYGGPLDWRLVLVGLSEDVSRYAEFGFTPVRMASSGLMFRERYGMPFAPQPKPRLSASSHALVACATRSGCGQEAWHVGPSSQTLVLPLGARRLPPRPRLASAIRRAQ